MNAVVALYIVAAAMVLVGFLVTFFDRRKRGRCTEETSATIVGVNKEINMDEDGNSTSYTPVFEFTAGGTTVRRAAGVSSSRRKKFKTGEVRQVCYNPGNPNEFYVMGEGGNSARGIILMVLGIAIAGLVLAAQLGVFGEY